MKCILQSDNIDGRTGGFGSTSTYQPVKTKLKPKPRTTAKPLTKQKIRGVEQEPVDLKRPAGNAAAKPSKRKKVENEIVLESEDGEVEEPGGGSDERLKVQVKETRAVTNDDIANSGEDDMRVEAEEHSKNMNGTKSKGRAKGRTQIQHKNPPLSKQPLKPMEVQASEEESMAEDQEVSSQQQTRPRKATSGRERAQVKQYTKGVDDIIRDGIDDLILKVRRPVGASSQTSGASSAKDAELARLKEKIGWVSNVVTARVLHVFLNPTCSFLVGEQEQGAFKSTGRTVPNTRNRDRGSARKNGRAVPGKNARYEYASEDLFQRSHV